MSDSPQPILQTQGVLGDMFTRLFREQFPAIMDQHGDQKVWMIVTTRLMHLTEESRRSGSYFKSARNGEAPVFTWKATGVFHNTIRQFRLDFLRHLGPDEMRCRVFLAICPGEETPDLSEVLLAYPVPPDSMKAGNRPAGPAERQSGEPSRPNHDLPPRLPLRGGEIPAVHARSDHDPAISARVIDAVNLDNDPESTAMIRNPDQTLMSPDMPQSWLPIDKVALNVDESGAPLPPVEPKAGRSASANPESARPDDDGAEEWPDTGTPTDGKPPTGKSPTGESPDVGEFKPREPVYFMDSDTAFRPAGTPYRETGASPPHELRGPIVGKNPRNLPGNLYQGFFGFERMPFNNTPDTTFFFPTEKHQEALSRLLYAISEKKGFVMISGEIGAGKSTLCRALLTQLPKNVKVALITHTHLDASQIIRAIAEDFGLDTTGCDRYDVHQKLNDYLIDQLAEDATVCIIIDEAQNLSPETLEEVRMISNLETESEKLVQLILLGQPELRDKIKLPSMKQLRQRISVQFHLVPLTRDETVEYIQHRLKVANPTEPLNFRRTAMVEVFRYSGGTPRLINTICDNTLVTGFTRGKHVITPALVREAAEDLELEPQFGGVAQFFKSW